MLVHKNSIRLTVVLALAGLSLPSQARNDRLLMPINESFHWPSYERVLGSDVAFQFGTQAPEVITSASIQVGGEIIARGIAGTARPQGSARKSEAQTCRDAYRDALISLREQTLSRGDNALLEIVSNYRDVAMDSATQYECHAGMTRAEVVLKGRSAKMDVALVRAVQAIALPGTSLPVPLPDADGAAANQEVTDESLIPHATERTRAGYREFLRRPFPKAFAIGSKGEWGWASGMGIADPDEPSDPKDRAVRQCQKHSPKPCALYAVDGRIVYPIDTTVPKTDAIESARSNSSGL